MMRTATTEKIFNFYRDFLDGVKMDRFNNPCHLGKEYPSWGTLKKYGCIVKVGERPATFAERTLSQVDEMTVNVYEVHTLIG